MNFNGKVAISTGAASGMGLLFAQNFASLGGNVVLCDINKEVLDEKVLEINSKNEGKAIVIEVKVADSDMGKVIGKQGRIAKAIRAVVKAAAAKEDKKVIVDIA